MSDPIVDCRFNLFSTGRKYTGHARNYIVENARKVADDPTTLERIKLNGAVGYYGHGRRMLAKKMELEEVETVTLPNGKTILVENIPSNVTVGPLNVKRDGTVEHRQKFIMENAPGKMAYGLWKSKVGGLSWACGGTDGGGFSPTRIDSYYGMDYVINPNFSDNRGYILESATDPGMKDMILENIVKLGIDEKEADRRMNEWIMSESMLIPGMRDQIEEAAITESALNEKIAGYKDELEDAHRELEAAKAREERRRQVVLESAQRHIIVVPENVKEALISMADEKDFFELIGFFENAKSVDMSQFPPIGGNADHGARPSVSPYGGSDAEYGTPEAGVDFSQSPWPMKGM